MTKSTMKIINIKPQSAERYFRDFYNDSALTFIGVIPEEAQLYRDYFAKYTQIDESKPCYMYTGKMMNDNYGLKGSVAYPNDIHFITFKLSTFKNPMAICLPRFNIGGRWFDDIVANNEWHMNGDI